MIVELKRAYLSDSESLLLQFPFPLVVLAALLPKNQSGVARPASPSLYSLHRTLLMQVHKGPPPPAKLVARLVRTN